MKALLAALLGCGLVAAAPPIRKIVPGKGNGNGTTVTVPAGYGVPATSSMIDCTSSVRFSYGHPLGGNVTDCGCEVKTTTVFVNAEQGNASNTPTDTIYYTVYTGSTSLSDDFIHATDTEIGHTVASSAALRFSSTATHTTTYPAASGTGPLDFEDITFTVTNRHTLTRTLQAVSLSASPVTASSSSASRTETVIVTETSQVLTTVHRTHASSEVHGVDASEISFTQIVSSRAVTGPSNTSLTASIQTAAPIATSIQIAPGSLPISRTDSIEMSFSTTATAPSTSEEGIVTMQITSVHTVTGTRGTGSGTVPAISTATFDGQASAPIILSKEGSATFSNFSPRETEVQSLPNIISDPGVVLGSGSLSRVTSSMPTFSIAFPMATGSVVSTTSTLVALTSLRFSSEAPGNSTIAGPTLTTFSTSSSTKLNTSSSILTYTGAEPSTTPAQTVSETASEISIFLPTPPTPPQQSTGTNGSSSVLGTGGTTSSVLTSVLASTSATATPTSALSSSTESSVETSFDSAFNVSSSPSAFTQSDSSANSAAQPTSSNNVSWVTSTFGGDGTTRGFPKPSSPTVSGIIQASPMLANSSAPVSTTTVLVIPTAGYGTLQSLSALSSTSISATGDSQAVSDSEPAAIATSFSSSSTATPVSNSTATGQPIADCGELGNFTINWDDEPIYVQDNMADPSSVPVFNPYHHLFFANGFSYFAPNNTITLPATYDPVSGPNLAIFTVPGDEQLGDAIDLDEYGMLPGMIGAGPRVADPAYWFNAHSAELGCDNGGAAPCNMTISGYKYAGIFNNQTKVIEQSAMIASCTELEDCLLQHVELVGFEAMSSIRFEAVVDGNLLRSWAVDNLSLGWWDNSCTAGLRRISSKK